MPSHRAGSLLVSCQAIGGSSEVAAWGYAVTTSGIGGPVVVPDGRCGLAIVDGLPWWMGPQSRPWLPERAGVHVVGVRLAFEAGRSVAGESLARWRDRKAPLAELWGDQDADRLAEAIAATATVEDQIAVLVDVAARLVAQLPVPADASELARLVQSEARVSDVAGQLGLSSRHVHRRCVDLFGLPPSTLRRVARLHRTARARHEDRSGSFADLAADMGYADQAHLAREFRALAGQAPRVALG